MVSIQGKKTVKTSGNHSTKTCIIDRSFGQQNWNIRDNIPGEPDVDYPIYSVPPISSFSCKGRHYGELC